MTKKRRFGNWKSWKRPSFHFYFVLFTMIVVMATMWLSGSFSLLIEFLVGDSVEIPSLVLMLGFSLIIGWILSFFLGWFLLKPIAKLQSAMKDVTEGDFGISIEEKSLFDEIENINHSFNTMMRELRANQAMQNDFVSNVSHEFKTPLNTIAGYATLLQDRTLSDEEREEYSREILLTTRAMTDLVGNILLLSKINNQAIDCRKDNFSLDEQIRKTVVVLEPKWSEKNIEFEVDLQSISILSNESLLSNVWRNLIENAIKFSSQNGKIMISLKKDGDNIEFVISDEGDGIKEEDKEKIFEKFFQSDTSHMQEGNGLGLSLVKKIVDLFGGSIEVKNNEEKGCTFTVKIPQ